MIFENNLPEIDAFERCRIELVEIKIYLKYL